MSALLWKYFFQDDVDNFRRVLAAAAHNASSQSSRGGSGGKSGTIGALATSPGPHLGVSPTLSSKKKAVDTIQISDGNSSTSASQKLLSTITLGRADVNWRDAIGVTLLHQIASSSSVHASEFAVALLEHPLLDLYAQDDESGWTALHRALYCGNITIARALMERDIQNAITHSSPGTAHVAGGLIKIKDREGNSPFDVYGASIAHRSILRPSNVPLLGQTLDNDDGDVAQGVSGDVDAGDNAPRTFSERTKLSGDEVFAFGSNKNFTLGFGDEDDRQYPERIYLKRPEHLLHLIHKEHNARSNVMREGKRDSHIPSPTRTITALPALVQNEPIIIQDVQLSKLHSAILTSDVEANLYICGFGSGGRLGTGDESTRFGFVSVHGGALAGEKIIDVALGQDHTVAISSHGDTFTWGSNLFGQLGYGTNTSSPNLKEDTPLQLLPRHVYGPLKREFVIGAAASRIHSTVFTQTSLYTFGKNEGQLGLVDSDARSLALQVTPRKVAASLFSSTIKSVSAIDKATICLLESHDVWVFANYGYTKMVFPLDGFSNYFLHNVGSSDRRRMPLGMARANQIVKITSGGDTFCAMSSMGDVFTVHVSQKVATTAVSASTTNPTKIRGALSAPQRVWSLKKGHMAVQDVDVGQDGSIIICTQSGSVWRRIKRAKVKDVNDSLSSEYKAKDYKFSRVPRLTNITAVRSNAFGGFAAVRRDCDVLKTQIEVGSNTLWKDLLPLLPFYGLGAEDSDTENPAPRFWTSSQLDDVASIRRAVLTTESLEEEIEIFVEERCSSSSAGYDLRLGTTISDVHIPVHEFILAGRSDVFRRAISRFREAYFFTIAEVMTIEYDKDGRTIILFQGHDFITILALVLYLYTDSVIDVWHHTKRAPQSAFRYRQIRVELTKLASSLNLRKLEQAVRNMTEPPKTLHDDLYWAIQDQTFFDTGDLQVQLEDGNTCVHSALVCQRCPFFEGLYKGHAEGRWLSSRREKLREPQDLVQVDLTHIPSSTFTFVLHHIYADADETMFDHVVTDNLDSFLDVVLDVMSVANELMLDRLSQCCQKMLGRFVDVRNVCSLLNAAGPCSVTDFKTAALEYICLNLEGMLENRLLNELEEDLMLELDGMVRQNQSAFLPISKNYAVDAQLFEDHPEMKDAIERSRQIRLDTVSLQTRLHERETKASSTAKVKSDLLESFQSPVSSRRPRRQSSGDHDHQKQSPSLRAKKSIADLIFEMEESEQSELDETRSHRPYWHEKHPATPLRKSPRLSASIPSDDGLWQAADGYFGPAKGTGQGSNNSPRDLQPSSLDPSKHTSLSGLPEEPANEHNAWVSASFAAPKLDMKDIMAQASAGKTSNISSELMTRSKGRDIINATSSPVKISQRERKRQQQQLQLRSGGSPTGAIATPSPQPSVSPKTHASPWHLASRGPTIRLRDVLVGEKSESAASQSNTRTPSPMTLRQTVAGRSPDTPRAASSSSIPRLGLEKASSTAKITPTPTINRLSSAPSNSFSSTALALPQVTPTVQSIRHTPAARAVEPTLQLSMADILAQQQTEKQLIKDAVAKRSLQEIQQEQAFQEWWDQESRRTQLAEEQERERNTAATSSRGTAATEGRGSVKRGRARNKGGKDGRGGRHDADLADGGTGKDKHESTPSRTRRGGASRGAGRRGRGS